MSANTRVLTILPHVERIKDPRLTKAFPELNTDSYYELFQRNYIMVLDKSDPNQQLLSCQYLWAEPVGDYFGANLYKCCHLGQDERVLMPVIFNPHVMVSKTLQIFFASGDASSTIIPATHMRLTIKNNPDFETDDSGNPIETGDMADLLRIAAPFALDGSIVEKQIGGKRHPQAQHLPLRNFPELWEILVEKFALQEERR